MYDDQSIINAIISIQSGRSHLSESELAREILVEMKSMIATRLRCSSWDDLEHQHVPPNTVQAEKHHEPPKGILRRAYEQKLGLIK